MDSEANASVAPVSITRHSSGATNEMCAYLRWGEGALARWRGGARLVQGGLGSVSAPGGRGAG